MVTGGETMDEATLQEIEKEFCPAPGVTREPSYGVPALVAEVRRLRALIAGRTTAPTREEFDALGAVGATLRVRWSRGDDDIPTHGGDYYWTAAATVPEGATWWAHGADGALIEWPKVEVSP